MATAVQTPVSALNEQFKRVDINDSLYGRDASKYQKSNVTDKEKQRLIFNTSYEPSLEWWQKNQSQYSKPKPEDDPLPAGFPEEVDSPSRWDGKVLINEPEKWLYTFTTEDLSLIDQAYEHFLGLKLDKNEISKDTFPIAAESKLYAEFQNAVKELQSGVGLRVLRGLPVDKWTREKQIVVFAGISSYIGPRRIKQGPKNVVHLRDITNLDADNRPAIVVKGQTSGNQVFHNDGSAGIVALITLGVAETGGLSQLSSVAQTYNDLASSRRDIVRELAKNDWKTKIAPNGTPLLFTTPDKIVISSYSRRPFFGFYEAGADVAPLSEEKHLALDAIHFTAEKYSLDLDLQKGDLEFFNNLTVFHARTASNDSAENQRHLVRIWLENPEQSLPKDLSERFAALNAGTAEEWPLEAWDE